MIQYDYIGKITPLGEDLFEIIGVTDKYTVDGLKATCTCPHWCFRLWNKPVPDRYCKHLWWLVDWLEEEGLAGL